MFEQLCNLDNLYTAWLQVSTVSGWKEETQRYAMNLMPNLMRLKYLIENFLYKPDKPRGFITNERGKPRWIESRSMDDRVVQRTVHDQIILPSIYPKLIYDNSASLENRGTDFFRRRLLRHLSQFASEYGNDGYILLIDFKKFFDNIVHETLIQMLSEIIPDHNVMEFVKMLIYENKVDVSYMSDEEYANCMNIPFNNIEYRLAVESGKIKQTGEKFMYKSMGIGSQLSQDSGLYYPHEIDNYCKIVKGIKGYARYMDDSYAIHHSKEFLWQLLDDIKAICNRLGIFINIKKTQIVNLKHEFSILQTRYLLQPDGNVIIMPNNDTFQRERRKLNKQAQLLVDKTSKITYDDIYGGYRSWRGNVTSHTNNALQSIETMDEYYSNLYIYPFMNGHEAYA